jgi:sugar lactone lactonase YvrE
MNIQKLPSLCCTPVVLFFLLIISGISNAQEVAFRVPDRNLLPEGITYSQKEKAFFISSTVQAKIVKVKDGKASDFITSGQDGFSGGIGLHVDDQRGILWALGTSPNPKQLRSRLFKYDLRSGHLLASFSVADTTALLNDLAISPEGAVYITDTNNGVLYTTSDELSVLEPWARMNQDDYPNGIAFHRGQLYVASFSRGLKRIDPRTKLVVDVSAPKEVSTKGLDGIDIFRHSIIGVGNGDRDPAAHFVSRFDLSDDGTKIERVTVLDRGNPAFKLPTTCVVVGSEVFIIANSHIDALNEEGAIRQGSELTEPVILRYKLEKSVRVK